MGAIQLCSAPTPRYSVTQSVEAIVISALDNAGVACGPVEFKIAAVFPAEFVKDGRVKTWPEIQSDIKAPAASSPFASLIKVDRTGGTQQPDSRSDFTSYASE